MATKAQREASRARIRARNKEANDKQQAQISNSKQSMSDNRGYVAPSSSSSSSSSSKVSKFISKYTGYPSVSNSNKHASQQSQARPSPLQVSHSGSKGSSIPARQTFDVQNARQQNQTQNVERRTKQIESYLLEQQKEKQQELENRKQRQQELDDLNKEIAKINAVKPPPRRVVGRRSNRPIYSNDVENFHRAQNKKKAPIQEKIKNMQNTIKNSDSTITRYDNTIDFFQVENQNLKKELSAEKSGSFSTTETQSTRGKKPPPQVSQSIRGIAIAGQNYNKIKNFLGIETTKTPPTRLSSIPAPKPQKTDQSTVERFTPTKLEYGTTRFSTAKFGSNQDYFSQKDTKQSDSQITTLPSGQIIEVKKPKQTNSDRYIAGLKSVPENFFQIGKESVEGIASDVKQGKIGTAQPTELKKDIIISPLGAITEHIGDPNYFQKTGKSLGELGADIKNDPFYYAGNTVSNAVVIASTLGIGKAPAIVRKLTPSKEAKARNIIDFTHPPQDIVKNEFVATGKTMKTKRGIEIEEYQPTKIKKQELETFGIQSSKQGDNIKLAGTEATGQTKTQKVSPIESFEKVGDTYGYETYRGTFKEGGKFQSVEAIMTPNPILRYSGKVQKSNIIEPTANKGIKLDIETGSAIKSAIEKNPTQSKEIFASFAQKGKGGEFFERPPSNEFAGLTRFDLAGKGDIGKVQKVSPETASAMGARGKEITTQESFYFDDLFGRLSANPQYGNLMQAGKIKTPKTDIPKQTPSLDSQYFAPDYLSGKVSLATAFDIKTKQPSKFESMTPYGKQFFDESVGLNKPRDFKKMKGFDLEKPPTSKIAENENPFGLLTKEKQEGVLSELKGGGDFTKTPPQSKGFQNYAVPLSDSGFDVSQSFLEPASMTDSRPQKQDTGFDVFSTQKESSKLKQPAPQKQQQEFDNIFDTDAFKIQKQPQAFGEKFDFAVIPAFGQGTKQTRPPKQIINNILDTPLETPLYVPEVIPEKPIPPNTPRTGGGGFPLMDFPDLAMDEYLKRGKKGKTKKRFWAVDPTTVLGTLKGGGSLGYRSQEFKQLKKGKKKKQVDDFDYSNIGF